jgi:hypothetical protein
MALVFWKLVIALPKFIRRGAFDIVAIVKNALGRRRLTGNIENHFALESIQRLEHARSVS